MQPGIITSTASKSIYYFSLFHNYFFSSKDIKRMHKHLCKRYSIDHDPIDISKAGTNYVNKELAKKVNKSDLEKKKNKELHYWLGRGKRQLDKRQSRMDFRKWY